MTDLNNIGLTARKRITPSALALGVLLLAFLSACWQLHNNFSIPFHDATRYREQSFMIEAHGLLAKFHYAPGSSVLFFLARKMCGLNEFYCMRAFNALAYSCLILFLYLLGWQGTGKPSAGVYAAGIGLFYPAFSGWTTSFYTEILFFPLLAISTWFCMRACFDEGSSKKMAFVGGLFNYATILVRPVAGVVCIAACIYGAGSLACRRYARFACILALLGGVALPAGLFMIRNYFAYGHWVMLIPDEGRRNFVISNNLDIQPGTYDARLVTLPEQEQIKRVEEFRREGRYLDFCLARLRKALSVNFPARTIEVAPAVDLPGISTTAMMLFGLFSFGLLARNRQARFLVLLLLLHHVFYAAVNVLDRYRLTADIWLCALNGMALGEIASGVNGKAVVWAEKTHSFVARKIAPGFFPWLLGGYILLAAIFSLFSRHPDNLAKVLTSTPQGFADKYGIGAWIPGIWSREGRQKISTGWQRLPTAGDDTITIDFSARLEGRYALSEAEALSIQMDKMGSFLVLFADVDHNVVSSQSVDLVSDIGHFRHFRVVRPFSPAAVYYFIIVTPPAYGQALSLEHVEIRTHRFSPLLKIAGLSIAPPEENGGSSAGKA